jgi:CrcB protein
LGGPARFFVSGFVARRLGETFPWGTLIVNISGCFAIGVIAALAAGGGPLGTPSAWLFFVTGVLGAYTTVSSFSLQTLALARDRELQGALAYIALSLALCVGAAALGFSIVALAGSLGDK